MNSDLKCTILPNDHSLCVSQKCVLSKNLVEHSMARDMIAELLTQQHGEYVFRIGVQPPHAMLFSEESIDAAQGWTGIERTMEQVDEIRESIDRLTDEVGGKVGTIEMT